MNVIGGVKQQHQSMAGMQALVVSNLMLSFITKRGENKLPLVLIVFTLLAMSVSKSLLLLLFGYEVLSQLFCDLMDYSPLGSSVHGIPQARIPVQFSSVTQSCPTLCDPMNCSMTGLPVHHQLLESTQTHVHWVSDAIQPSHPLSSPSPPTLNLSQHQGLFK